LPWALALLALLPFVSNHRFFANLFWFGDEFDLIDQIDRTGYATWTWKMFAENFVPLFKVLWGGLVFVGGGSYFFMLSVAWLTHALNVGLLAYLMMKNEFALPAVILAAVGFGLTASNLETLGWSVQWSAMLAVTFFLLAAIHYTRICQRAATPTPRDLLLLGGWGWASAWCFARGTLTGAVLAGMAILPWTRPPGTWPRRILLAAACILPAVLTGVLIFKLAPTGPHHDLFKSGQWRRALAFGTWYFALNPLASWVDGPPLSWRLVLQCGILKLGMIAVALICSKPAPRRVLIALFVLELGNTFLLGVGRYGGDLTLAVSSRYQYSSLLSTVPCFAAVFQLLLQAIPANYLARPALTAGVIALAGWHVYRPWEERMAEWSGWRGMDARHLLLEGKPLPATNAVPGISFMSNARAKRLVEKYHLH
jgi:hypothetical protein